MRFSIRAMLAALVFATALLAAPAARPLPVAGVGPLPTCRLDDILTEPRGYDDWATTQVDWILSLGPKYRPPDLVPVSNANIAGGGYIREVAIDDLRAMAAAARKNGTPLEVLSPFRGYKQQVALFNGYAGWRPKTKTYTNFESAVTFSARPGHSEHQTGLTIDFVAPGDTGLTSNWEVTRTGKWMANHAWEFGWLMSYPDGKKDLVCYRYEPWHYRYVGRDLAAKIRESGLTIREYLWANYTQVDPACVALPPPKLVTPGEPRSCAFAAASPSTSPATSPTTSNPAPPATSAASPTPTLDPGVTPSAAGGLEPAFAIGGFVLLALAAVAVVAWWQGRARQGRRRF